jgi:sugar phosphate isomerase/epimerase
MVELAFSTNAYTEYALPEAVRRIADHGYDGVELLGDDPHAFFPTFDRERERALIEALEETGLAVSNVNANTAMGYYDDAPPSPFFEPSVITADDRDRAWRIAYTKRAIDLADAVGSPAICLATGGRCPGTRPNAPGGTSGTPSTRSSTTPNLAVSTSVSSSNPNSSSSAPTTCSNSSTRSDATRSA